MMETVIAAFIIGLLGAGHCLGMCGGINAALSFAIPKASRGKRVALLAAYNVGRVSSYTLIGAVVGLLGLGANALNTGSSLPLARIIAGVLLIAMGFYLADWWKILTVLEKVGAKLWRYIQPLGKSLMPVDSIGKALLFGALWGWLPCGLVYSALAYSAVQAEPLSAAIVMAAFGAGTLPAVFVGGLAGAKLKAVLQQKLFRTSMAIFIILFGLWTLWGGLGHRGHSHPDHIDQGHMGHENMHQEHIKQKQNDGAHQAAEAQEQHRHHH